MSGQVRKFNYGIEDDRFYIEYQVGNIYLVRDKLKGEDYILDNIDCDTTPSDLLQIMYEKLEDEE